MGSMNISRSIRGMSLNHRQEVLDAHMNHSNWKKLVHIGKSFHYLDGICLYESALGMTVPSLLRRWKHLSDGLEASLKEYDALSKHFKYRTAEWLEMDK
jgi:hypothetical protein